ncbi:capsular polysaccharide biosynthesis protein [Polynucleobacter difficilis]|uniref:capsular polysaccharide biosynthesis protein n=1 Tax=Polynucleobacter difficilis TaxID=556054 RepID=UPI000D356E45|nr:capsular polysaccharide biosynthesis protein [Polynucleobacter difficilis]
MPDFHPVSLFRPPALVSHSSPGSRPRYGITSWGLYRQNLASFFPECDVYSPLHSRLTSELDGVLAWGTKPSAFSASALATRLSIPLLRVEDGFLYGLEPASRRMSLVVDDLGIYYDARHPSRLEALIASPLNADQVARAQLVRDLWIQHGVSKYNHAPDWLRSSDAWRNSWVDVLGDTSGDVWCNDWLGAPYILLIDQTRGDQSVAGAFADESSFIVMLEAALAQTAIEHIVIKVHPEVVRGTKLGHFDLSPGSAISRNPRIRIMTDDYSLPSVIKEASAVYTVSSQAGFEALLWGKTVYTFGMPFYAGWGLTYDYLHAPERRCSISLEQLIYAALVRYPRYLHPETNQLCEVEDLISYLGFQRVMRSRFKQRLIPLGFSRNKLRHLGRFTQGAQWIGVGVGRRSAGVSVTGGCVAGGSDDHHPRAFVDSDSTHGHSAYPDSIAVRWGSTPIGSDDYPIHGERIQVEDGFIRSIGLGAALAKPYSWVFDRLGIYYDARSVSDLEHILQTMVFDLPLLTRATLLQGQLITLGISKYNLESLKRLGAAQQDLAALKRIREEHPTRPCLFVIGQVEVDASVRFGGVDILSNTALLRAVREQFPNAFIVYKPHPDIATSVRFSGGSSADHQRAYDLLVSDVALVDCLPFVDALHTISSLSGFEALIRGVPVFCYGLPFYAGWGLTTDRHRLDRRTRKLSLLELIAGSLILYPSYLHPKSQLYCTPEALITALQDMKTAPKGFVWRLWNASTNACLARLMGLIHRVKGM